MMRAFIVAVLMCACLLSASVAMAERPTPPEPDCPPGYFCYNGKDQRRIKVRLAELIGCRKKLKRRDSAIVNIKKAVNAYVKKDKAISRRIEKTERELAKAQVDLRKAESQITKAWAVLGSVTGVVIVAAVVAVVIITVNR